MSSNLSAPLQFQDPLETMNAITESSIRGSEAERLDVWGDRLSGIELDCPE